MKYLTTYNIFEGRQRGNLYHIFDIEKCLFILDTNSLKSYKFANISTTRNKNMNSYLGDHPTSIFKLELDGDKLSDKYKIRPFSFTTTEIGAYDTRKRVHLTEYEEAIMTQKIPNINKYVKKFIIIKSKVEYLKRSGWFDSDGGNLNGNYISLPEFLQQHISKIKELFGDIWIQDGFIIRKDDEWLNSILNFPIKKINHGYGLYHRGYVEVEDKFGLREHTTPVDKRNKDIKDLVVGYDYENLYLSKSKKFQELPELEDYRLYVFDFEYKIFDVIEETDDYIHVKRAKLSWVEPVR